jgi:hypothetical protein
VLQVLVMLLPVIGRLVEYPTIARAYFDLLEDLLVASPDKLSNVPAEQRGWVLNTIWAAVSQPDPTLMRAGLKALRALAAYHVATIGFVQEARFKRRETEWAERKRMRDAHAAGMHMPGRSSPGGRPPAGRPPAGRGRIVRLGQSASTNSKAHLLDRTLTPNAPNGTNSGSGGPGGSGSGNGNGNSGMGGGSPQRMGGGSSPNRGGRSSPSGSGGARDVRPVFVRRAESPFGNDLARFQSPLIQLILFQSRLSADLLDHVADALLPVICIAPKQYESAAEAFVREQTAKAQALASAPVLNIQAATSAADSKLALAQQQSAIISASIAAPDVIQNRLMAGFQALVRGLSLEHEDTRAVLIDFRQRVRDFVQSVRAFVFTR